MAGLSRIIWLTARDLFFVFVASCALHVTMPSPVHLPFLLSHASYGGSNTIELVLCSVLELLHWNHPGVGFVGSSVPLEPSVWAAKYSFSRGRFRTINDTCVPLPTPPPSPTRARVLALAGREFPSVQRFFFTRAGICRGGRASPRGRDAWVCVWEQSEWVCILFCVCCGRCPSRGGGVLVV